MDRFARIAEKIVAGYGYSNQTVTFRFIGWQPVNVDVTREISRLWFPALCDDGEKHDCNMRIVNIKRETPPLNYMMEREMRKKGDAPSTLVTMNIPKGSINEVLKVLSRQMLGMGIQVSVV